MSDSKYEIIKSVEGILTRIRKMDFEDLVLYDVKNEWIEEIIGHACKKMNNVLHSDLMIDVNSATSFQKICCYKICKIDIDCDVSLFNMVIYAIAYNLMDAQIEPQERGDKYCLRKEDRDYIGDTMNSYATSVRDYLRKFNKNQDIYIPNAKCLKNEYERISKDNYWDACILNNYEYFDELITDEIKMFIAVNHTIGNFIPVPKHFNLPRAKKTKDYWDLTLDGIYRWYEVFEKGNYESNAGLKDIIGTGLTAYIDEKENIEICKKWLSKFGNWDNFVEINFMQDFVNKAEEENRKFGRPKELWKGHFEGKPFSKESAYSEFFYNSSSWIIERSRRIAMRLKSELSVKNNEELIRELFADKN